MKTMHKLMLVYLLVISVFLAGCQQQVEPAEVPKLVEEPDEVPNTVEGPEDAENKTIDKELEKEFEDNLDGALEDLEKVEVI